MNEKMLKITIDDRPLEVPCGTTILHAAQSIGIDIPTMCWMEEIGPLTSCMVCVVKVRGSAGLTPSCSTPVADGMVIETCCDEVIQARRMCIELLLSDHLGDCQGPCQVICPGNIEIPKMIRHIRADRMAQAVRVVKDAVPLAGCLSRICHAPCENGCRRSQIDQPVAICLLKRFVADWDMRQDVPYIPDCQPRNGKRAVIVGSGPAGLAAAWKLLMAGVECTVFDSQDKPGGMLRYGTDRDKLPEEVLDFDIDQIMKMGLVLKSGRKITAADIAGPLRDEFDAVVIAAGPLERADELLEAMPCDDNGLIVHKKTLATDIPGVFAAGDVITRRRVAIRSIAQGKTAAESVIRYLGLVEPDSKAGFNCAIGRLRDQEKNAAMYDADPGRRTEIARSGQGLSPEQASAEAARCMHCDCRKADNCKLRDYAERYGASAKRFSAVRRDFQAVLDHPDVVYEPGKCIQCGICVSLAAGADLPSGPTFTARGYDVRVSMPFNATLRQALGECARKCVEACPTGALAFREDS